MSTVPTDEGAGPAVGLRLFLALAAFFLLLAVVYAATSDGEWAGAALLALSAGLSLLTGGFLFLVER
ncbi:MAG: cytochrome c oxidase subunit 4, partial [Acidimicrobiales bacterium]